MVNEENLPCATPENEALDTSRTIGIDGMWLR